MAGARSPWSGRRLDSKEAVLRFLAELGEGRAAGNPAYERLP